MREKERETDGEREEGRSEREMGICREEVQKLNEGGTLRKKQMNESDERRERLR